MSNTQTQILSNLQALGFNTTTAAAMMLNISQGVGLCVDNTITEIANSQNYITQTLTDKQYGGASYYTTWAKAFQLGYNLSINPTTGNYYYATIDTSAQIIAQAAFGVTSAGLYLKVAGINSTTNQLQQIPTAQLASFQNYFNIAEIPGLPVSIINSQPDQLTFSATCTFYNTYDLSIIQTNLQAALTAFQNTFNFNGEFFAGDLADYIKGNTVATTGFAGVPGVRDFYVYNTILDGISFAGYQLLNAGYFNFVSGVINNVSYNSVNP